MQSVSRGLLTREPYLPVQKDASESGFPRLTVPGSLYIPQYFIIYQISSGSREQRPEACSHWSVESKDNQRNMF